MTSTARRGNGILGIVLRRILVLPLVLLGIALIVFTLNRLVPGDPAQVYAGGDRADPADVARLRELWGLDRPVVEQFGRYLGQLLRGDLGWSFSQRADVLDVLAAKTPATIELAVAALVIGIPSGLALGVLAARRPRSWVDRVSSSLAVAGMSTPVFWLGFVLVFVFSVKLGWFPMNGRFSSFAELDEVTGFMTVDALLAGDGGAFVTAVRHLVLPAATLAVLPAAVMARFTRVSFVEVLGSQYILAARAFGIPTRTILWRLAAKNAVLPLINLLSLIVPSLVVGAVLVEIVFTWPGVGRFLLEALQSRDYIVVQSVTLLVGVLYVLLNLVADMAHAALDPRARR
ncbi:dipeptide transport system permease protein [Actinomadura meyerae]|uniref:Dipeptide transport system permease protein n=1 Tax=Actinomadura meyerae TaxID=240840 RepID=A0A239P4R8_9ACTN|nr:ABC transporter permease [Actinomadura meyerae]SNT62117.1 dipeptide transport system permease protein [Actinomadura meyerae]